MANVDSVKVAPEMGEIKFSEKRDAIYCSFNGCKVTYKLPEGVAFNNNDEFHKKAFQSAIAFSSNSFHLQRAMDSLYNVSGKAIVKEIVEG